MHPLLSVIVPVYNGQDYLEKCIISIENQTYDNIEIIIINDGSTDNTAAVCVSLRKTYENIRVINTEDEGVSVARNTGIDAAKGTFITFVDADDRLRPKTLEVLYDCIMNTGCDVAGCRFLAWKTEEEWNAFLEQKYRIGKAEKYIASEYLQQQILNGNSRCWSKLYRRSAVGNLRFQKDLTIGEDMLFLVKLLPYLRGIAETDYPGYGYFQNPDGAMNRIFSPRYMDQITCWEMAREEMLRIDCNLEAQVTSILIMGILLTAGKIARLSLSDQRKQKQYVKICHDKLRTELQVAGAYEMLSNGYKVKAKFFATAPSIYLLLYHFRKYV